MPGEVPGDELLSMWEDVDAFSLRRWKCPEDHLNFIMTSDVFDHVGCPSRPMTV